MKSEADGSASGEVTGEVSGEVSGGEIGGEIGGTGTGTVPGAAGLLRDFVNTAEPEVDGEDLDGPEALARWCVAHGLLDAGARLTADDVATAVAVREGLRGVLQAHAGHEVPAGATTALEAALDRVPVRAAFDDAGDLRLRPAADRPIAHVVAGLLDAVRQATADGTWSRLKVCARDSCRWAFYDASRNRSGRWCSMAGCGNVVKMQRSRVRRRDLAPAGGR
jgi:predicted RNA-binding Zn ribbon-like protein